MCLLIEPFVSAEVEYRRERAMAGRSRTSLPSRPRRRSVRSHRARALAHRFAIGH